MMSGQKKKSDSKHEPLMVYMPPSLAKKARDYAKENNVSVSSLVRQGIKNELCDNQSPYTVGYKEGIKQASYLIGMYFSQHEKTVDQLTSSLSHSLKEPIE